MKKSKAVLAVVLTLSFVFVAGCFTYISTGFGIYRHPRYQRPPGYCYDCHYRPGWTKIYVECRYHDFYFLDDGYWYRPKRGKDRIYVFKDYDYRKDKEFKKYYEKRWLKEKDKKRIEQQKKAERRRKR